MKKNLANIRRDYSREELTKASVAGDPFVQFGNWFDEYMKSEPLEPTACIVSTSDANGIPSSRVVLLKGYDANGFVFYTNYESRKGRALAENSNVTLLFYWPELERQISITGVAEKTSREESEAYFASRPLESKIGAWASKQSSVLGSRADLVARVDEMRSKFSSDDVPCPDFWGGYRVVPSRFEFWQGRPSRLHDRISYELDNGAWRTSRLSP
jgi:pyridoxamine 5'-phosphate oxidase